MELRGTRAEGGSDWVFLVGLHKEGQLVGELACVDRQIALAVIVGLEEVELELDVSEVLIVDCG